jgi:hypothetical protein
MSDPRAATYSLSKADAEWLAGLVGLPVDVRAEVLTKYAAQLGMEALVNLFAQFIGLANSVVSNSADAIEVFAIIEGDMHPYTSEKLNLPTIFGACNGAIIAHGIDASQLCAGCAFRLGTFANQSASTTCDADWCSHPGETPFMCHMDLDDQGEPTKGCAGFAQLRAKRKAAAS